jgi:hypothetical protein
MAADSEEVAGYVSALVQGATQAVRDRDIKRVVDCLVAAVELYEQHPNCMQKSTSQLRDLLVFIRPEVAVPSLRPAENLSHHHPKVEQGARSVSLEG